MDFEDRETRFEAEIMLRKLCKVNCSVPYPKRMRNLLLDLVNRGKALQPNCYIRTKVNVEKLTVEAHAKTASGWLDLGLKQNIPLDILGGTVDPAAPPQVLRVTHATQAPPAAQSSQASQSSQGSQEDGMVIDNCSQSQVS
jgi:hypothetical protein